MNRIYSLVWNRKRGTLQVASELARSHGGAAATGTGRRGRTVLSLAVLAALGLTAAPAGAQSCTTTLSADVSGPAAGPAHVASDGDTVCVDAGVDVLGGDGTSSSANAGAGLEAISPDHVTVHSDGHIGGGDGMADMAAGGSGGAGGDGVGGGVVDLTIGADGLT